NESAFRSSLRAVRPRRWLTRYSQEGRQMSWKSISLVAFMLVSACRPIPPQVPTGSGTHAVRGYIAAAVGNSAKAESGGIYSRAIAGKAVYLPGATVHLHDAGRATRSHPTRTDLSHRLTLCAA